MEELANKLISKGITYQDVLNKVNEYMGLEEYECELLDNYTCQELQCVLWWMNQKK